MIPVPDPCRSLKDQRHLPGAEFPRFSSVGGVQFRVVGQVAFLAKGGEVLIGVVGGVVVQMSDCQHYARAAFSA